MEITIQAVAIQNKGISKTRNLSYVGSMLFADIARLIDDERLYVPNQPELDDFAQRKPNTLRIKQIAKYILENYVQGNIFFPPICINCQPNPVFKDGKLFLPYYSVSLRLTDGQHRCYGIREALKQIQQQDLIQYKILSEWEIGVLFYGALSLEEERQAFRDQNLLVQRPNTSLSHYFDQRDPAVFIAKELIKKIPQFNGNVEQVENGLGKHNPKLLTLSTLVQTTKHMFPHLKSKQDLKVEINWAVAYWKAVIDNLPIKSWDIQTKEERRQQRINSLVGTAVVFQALGMLAYDLCKEEVCAEDLEKWLKKISEINWSRDNNLWLEKGITQIGANQLPIISNTKTTIKACHRFLRELVGIL